MTSFTVWPMGRRVAALRRAVRRLAGTTLPSWRWTEPDDLAGLTNELSAMTARLRVLATVVNETTSSRPRGPNATARAA